MNKKIPTFKVEKSICQPVNNKNFLVAGVDEVGRGALAGPIVAAAVIFTKYDKVIKELKDINDSKLLTANKRFILNSVIRELARDYSFGTVEPNEIDKFGIGAANILAFRKAIKGLKKCNTSLIDGRAFKGLDCSYQCMEKGESVSISIAAASIIAKVYRDNLMQEIHDKIYKYDFASNKGYGSKKHFEALRRYGPSKHHRKSFLKKLDNQLLQNSLFNLGI